MKSSVDLPDVDTARILLGPNDSHRRLLRDRLKVNITLRGERLLLDGSEQQVTDAVTALERMITVIENSPDCSFEDAEFQWLLSGAGESREGLPSVVHLSGRRRIEPKGEGQKQYILSMHANDITFGLGPAGTGKTYLAVACAVEALRLGQVRRIILARPAVEAGEKLGFLPGDMQQKVNPYLRPLYDSLGDMLPRAELAQYLETGIIEVAPLAFMRGRTLNRAFVILDEAQNTTPGQMKMFLTRLGARSKAVITGDPTQVDLPEAADSGLVHARETLAGIEGISFIALTKADVVRHRLVREIIHAYEEGGVTG
ncbi:MAG: PhoH family protein [Planctomycetota bacterium]|jgi:phosphate starvation-inducible PhoH-like protein